LATSSRLYPALYQEASLIGFRRIAFVFRLVQAFAQSWKFKHMQRREDGGETNQAANDFPVGQQLQIKRNTGAGIVGLLSLEDV
jgi:hypothetical protein